MKNFSALMESYNSAGLIKKGRMDDPGYRKALAEANNLINGVVNGKMPSHLLSEAMGTSDFPILLGDNLSSRLLGAYNEAPSTYQTWCYINRNVRDFRTQYLKYLNTGNLLERVKEGQKGPEISVPEEGRYHYAVETYEESMKFSWEMLVNDDLNAFQSLPSTLGQDAKNTVEKFATGLLVDAAGPHASFFKSESGQVNLITNKLNADGLRAGVKAFRAIRKPDGSPMNTTPAILAVAPALEETAKDLLGASNLMFANLNTANSKQVGFTLQNSNRFGGLQLCVLDWLPNIVTADGPDDESWFLLGDPNQGRGAFEMGFLRGIGDQPLVLKKKADAEVMGGVEAAIGDFDSRSFEYKVTHVFGGCQKDWRFAVGSNGSGS
ncbi:hypothetical protein EOM86_02050 [Candidatus Nomurabacteria bacterium]|nr:hypothetical protein [Candidatus Nomurabacteria bacterium]